MTAQRHHWIPAELDVLRAQYPHQITRDIAALLGIEQRLVYAQANRMGLRKSAEFAASDKSGRMLKGGKLGQQNQFKPGQTPWNKGTTYMPGGRCAETQFKKGCMSGAAQYNYVPIGSHRVTRDGTLERKVSDDPTLYPARRWVPVSRLVWEAAYGPIPPGHVVAFKPGRKSAEQAHITLDALECVSRAEMARRNSIWANGNAIGRLYQLKGAIARQANRITQGASA